MVEIDRNAFATRQKMLSLDALLVSRGGITPAKLDRAKMRALRQDTTVSEILRLNGSISAPQMTQIAADSIGAQVIDPLISVPDARLVSIAGPAFCARAGLLPWRKWGLSLSF